MLSHKTTSHSPIYYSTAGRHIIPSDGDVQTNDMNPLDEIATSTELIPCESNSRHLDVDHFRCTPTNVLESTFTSGKPKPSVVCHELHKTARFQFPESITCTQSDWRKRERLRNMKTCPSTASHFRPTQHTRLAWKWTPSTSAEQNRTHHTTTPFQTRTDD